MLPVLAVQAELALKLSGANPKMIFGIGDYQLLIV